MRARGCWVRLHRWAGLAMAGFLVLAGATGSLIAFEDELEAWLNPALFVVAPPLDAEGRPGTMLDPFVLRELAQRELPHASVVSVELDPQPLRSIIYRLEPDRAATTINQAFVDPYTGHLLGARTWGESLFQRETLLTFLYRLHIALALPAPYGRLLLGAVALLWTLDCFVGFYLTLPRGRPLLAKWRNAWRIKTMHFNTVHFNTTRFNFDLHRALGLWVWPMLLVFAWSSVLFNLRDEVYQPAMAALFNFDELDSAVLNRTAPTGAVLDWREAYAHGHRHMARLAGAKRFEIQSEGEMRYVAALGLYTYSVRSSLDPGGAGTAIYIDAVTGALLGSELPTGGAAGNTITSWLQVLHTGHVFGVGYRMLVSATGLAVVVLSATGLIIWLHKRRARNRGAACASRG